MTGCSGSTREKWKRFEYLLRVHAAMCRLIMTKHRWADSAYSYFDFFAGPGLYDETDHAGLAGEFGSPVRALTILKEIFVDPGGEAANGEPLAVRAFFHDPNVWHRLQHCLDRLGMHGGIVDDVPCEQAVDALIEGWPGMTGCSPWKPLGLAFFDPNGQPPWSSIKAFSSEKCFDHIDFLINVNSTVIKRVLKSSIHAETRTPTQHLVELGKDDVYLWEPTPGDIHQFALAYCTNGPFPEFRKLGFHFINSDKGRQIADRIDMTAKEYKSSGDARGFLRGMEDL
jgi:three-Cys-motif partner protein